MKWLISLACIVLLTHSICGWFGSDAETTTTPSPNVEKPITTTELPLTPTEAPPPPPPTEGVTTTTVPVLTDTTTTDGETVTPAEGETTSEGSVEGAEGDEPSPLDGVDFYMYSVKDTAGNDHSLEAYRGFVTLVVNVASKCGYTESTYKDLVSLQTKFEPTGAFTVLAFPCNQFWEQEPGTNEEIYKFATTTYQANFPIFAKTDVHGDNATDAYHYLAQATGYAPQWNFWKYLVDHTGHVVDVWSHETPAIELEGWIEDAISKALGNVEGAYTEGYGDFNETEHHDHDHAEL